MKEKIFDSCLIVASFFAALISYLGIAEDARTERIKYSFYVFCSLIVLLLLLNWIFYYIGKPKSFDNRKKDKIYNYLQNLYKKAGHCYIFSRGSMTWFTHGTIKNSLKKKCKENQLTIIVPNENEYTDELKKEGGKVFICSELNIENFASWSIINPEGNDCIIALGTDINNKHYIREYNVKNMDFVNASKLIAKLLDNLSKKV